MSKRTSVVSNGERMIDLAEAPEVQRPANLAPRTWYVQVQVSETGRLQGRPYTFGTSQEALAAIAQLESEHREHGWQHRLAVLCWVE
jgi:hypothetical protein